MYGSFRIFYLRLGFL